LHENLLCVSPQAGKDSRAICSSSKLEQYAQAVCRGGIMLLYHKKREV
jgi:hypothetical protein